MRGGNIYHVNGFEINIEDIIVLLIAHFNEKGVPRDSGTVYKEIG